MNREARRPVLDAGRREVILSAVDGALSIGAVTVLPGGRSSRTAERIEVTTTGGTVPVVLKRFPADRHGAVAEWRALRAVEHFPVPSPRPLFADPDGARFGEPAVVMGALPGRLLGVVTQGMTWLANAAAAMASLHAVPLTAVPAQIPAWPRLLDRWTPDGLPPALAGPAAEVISQLRQRAEVARSSFCHGDFYLGNLLFTGEELTGIVDWERARVMPAGNEIARFRMDLAIHPGGAAPDAFLDTYSQQTGTPAVDDLALWDVLAGTVGLAGAEHSRQGLEDIGVSLDILTITRRAAGFLERALARC